MDPHNLIQHVLNMNLANFLLIMSVLMSKIHCDYYGMKLFKYLFSKYDE